LLDGVENSHLNLAIFLRRKLTSDEQELKA